MVCFFGENVFFKFRYVTFLVHLGRVLDQQCSVFLHYQINVEGNRATLPFPLRCLGTISEKNLKKMEKIVLYLLIMNETFSLRISNDDVRLIISFYNKHFTSLMVLNVFNFFIFYRSKIQIVKRKTHVRGKVKLFKWSLFYFYLNKMESKSKSTEGNQRIYHQNSSSERHNSFNTKRIVISNRKVCSRSEEL